MRELCVHRLGHVEYTDGLALMQFAGDAVRAAQPADTDHLFLVEHPKVLTIGRSAGMKNVLASPAWLEKQGFEIHHTDRGGDVTYHGPGQIVAYPVLDIADRPDVKKYVASLEEAMIRTCSDYGVTAGRHEEHRGAWVGQRKIGAVGVHLSRWITSHGIAFNVTTDLDHFALIVPCGIGDPRLGVTSLKEELGRKGHPVPALREVGDRLSSHLAQELGRSAVTAGSALRTVSVVVVESSGRVLLLKRSAVRGGFWQPVTGRLEAGESPAEAARRELREETGFEAEVLPLGYEHAFGIDPRLSGAKNNEILLAEETAFVARIPSGTVRLSAEHVEAEWLRPDEALARLSYPGLRRAVKLATAG